MKRLLGLMLIGFGLLLGLTAFIDGGDHDREWRREWHEERDEEIEAPAAPQWENRWGRDWDNEHDHSGVGIFLGILMFMAWGVLGLLALGGFAFWWLRRRRHQRVQMV